MPFTNQNLLVIGGAGFVGANLAKRLLKEGAARVTVVDNLLSAERENLPADSRITLIEGSITDDAILAQLEDGFDYAFQLATYHGNQSSMADPIADHDNNTFTTLKFYEHIKNFKRLKKVVYSSAGCTVAEKTFDKARATDEDAPVSLYLDSPYQMSKIFGEFYSNYYWRAFDLPVVKARFQNVYGPGEVLGAGRWRGTPSTIWRNVTPVFIYQALNGMALTVENGAATRDFIYVDDIVSGLLASAAKGAPGGVYNLASGKETSIWELAVLINGLTGNKTPVANAGRREWDHSGKRFGSTEKARRELCFEAKTDIREGLSLTIDWTREHMDFINRCVEKHKPHLNALQ
ncbi:MAG: NAD-dependent epimerase/dehydratase family protein [Clostridiales bacterium]|jgi:nucleoside-diphosphate-sugar epimerase|nr:NAD-dependent epimerase/dehydratase family protein [Clostridiales bacterium]